MLTSILALLVSLFGDPCAERLTPRQAAAAIRAEADAQGVAPFVADYLVSVARRESSLRPWVMHLMPRDVEAARAAWRRLHHRHKAAGNPWAQDRERWGTIGLFGFNSNYHAPRVHPKMDPRKLCRTAVSVRAYLYAARSALRKMSVRRCVDVPRLGDIHRAVQGGRVCPAPGEGLHGPLAAKVVSAADFGRVP